MIKFSNTYEYRRCTPLFRPIDMGQIEDMLYQKLRFPDYTTYLCTCIYVFGQTGGIIWPLSLCPLLVAQVIVYTVKPVIKGTSI